jgi:hypothetical protein
MSENYNIIKIGICHNYCCKKNWYEIYYILKNNVSNELEILLFEYTNNKELDIMMDNPFYDLLKNNLKYEEGNENKYENCKFKLYSQDC